MQLRDARLVHTQFRADLLHRHLTVVVEGDDALLARRQRFDGATHTFTDFALLVGEIGALGFGRHEHRR
jgi:hypothetical protein